MMVPSRSKKTVFPSAIFETVAQFIGRNCGRSELAHDHRAGVISNLRCLQRRRTTAECQGKQCDRSVARTRNVKDLARFRWHMMWFLIALEKHHPFLAQRDQNQVRPPFL